MQHFHTLEFCRLAVPAISAIPHKLIVLNSHMHDMLISSDVMKGVDRKATINS